jgi:hypothetical protein
MESYPLSEVDFASFYARKELKLSEFNLANMVLWCGGLLSNSNPISSVSNQVGEHTQEIQQND